MTFIKKNWQNLFFRFVLLSYVFVVPVVSFAQGNVPAPCDTNVVAGRITNPICTSTLSGLIKTLLEGLIKIGIPVVALAVVYCGFLFVAARGKPEELKKAKDALLYTLIGAAILFGSWAIASLISSTVFAL